METAIAGSKNPVMVPAKIPAATAVTPVKPNSKTIKLTRGPRAVPKRAIIIYSRNILPATLDDR